MKHQRVIKSQRSYQNIKDSKDYDNDFTPTLSKKEKKRNVSNAPKLKYTNSLSTHNFEVLGTIQAKIQALLKKRKKRNISNVSKSKTNQNRT